MSHSFFSSVLQGRHHVFDRGVDRGAERALRRLALHPALLVLPLLPGQVQEVPGTGRPRREGVSVNDFIYEWSFDGKQSPLGYPPFFQI